MVDRWLTKAEEDLKAARLLSDQGLDGSVYFHCQQSIEKAIKAILVAAGIPFGKTHDLAVLQDLAVTVDKDLAKGLGNVDTLTPFAVRYRYPGIDTDEEVLQPNEAIDLAASTLDSIQEFLRSKTSADP